MKVLQKPVSNFQKRIIDLNHKKVFNPPTFKLHPPTYSIINGATEIKILVTCEHLSSPAQVIRHVLKEGEDKREIIKQMYQHIANKYTQTVLDEWEKVK